jgi:predicted Zn-dependent protease
MILVHNEMNEEAEHLRHSIESVFGIAVRPVTGDTDNFLWPMPEWEGFSALPNIPRLDQTFPRTAVLLLTSRDIFANTNSIDDDWLFGINLGSCITVATARIQGPDARPRFTRSVDKKVYLRRLSLVAMHEVGHELLKTAPHHQETAWINGNTGDRLDLGPHCDDNTCAMYQSVDISAPHPSEGYVEMGERRLFDAGLDDHLTRLRTEWFCTRCSDYLEIPDPYQRIGQ